MGRGISPWVPVIKSVRSALPARSGFLRPEFGVARRVVKYGPVFFLLSPALLLSSSVLVAQTRARVYFQAQTFSTINTWYYVLIAVATFLIQAFLILWLLVSHTRR